MHAFKCVLVLVLYISTIQKAQTDTTLWIVIPAINVFHKITLPEEQPEHSWVTTFDSHNTVTLLFSIISGTLRPYKSITSLAVYTKEEPFGICANVRLKRSKANHSNE